MKSNKGITLVSLLASLILIIILAATTIVTSMNAYNQMKFEGAKAELEEVQKLVDEIAIDYQTWLKEPKAEGAGTSYSDYFNSRYSVSPSSSEAFSNKLLSVAANKSAASTLLSKTVAKDLNTKVEASSTEVFYFTANDLVKYFDLKGIDPVAVDFSTRNVYSVSGIKDSSDSTKIYYTPAEWGSNKVIAKTGSGAASPTVTATKKSNSGNMYDIELSFSTKIVGNIEKVYMKESEATTYSEVDSFRDITAKTDTITKIRVVVQIPDTSKNYVFKLVDNSKNSYESSSAKFN